MIVIIAGSRSIKNKDVVYEAIDTCLYTMLNDNATFTVDEIVSGGAVGVDTIAREYASDKKIVYKEFRAKWDDLSEPGAFVVYSAHGPYDKLAGIRRNRVMARYAASGENGGMLIAIWNGVSKGTKNMIEEAKKEGLIVKEFLTPCA